MPSNQTAGLLGLTRTLIVIGFAVDLAIVVILLFVLVALLLGRQDASFVGGLAAMPRENAYLFARIGVTGMLLASLLALPMLRQALHLVDSARMGDPFVPENGRRLRRIGWLLLAINVVTNLGITSVSIAGLFTVLMIFVIARIFDTGSAMRDELRGTV